MQKTLTDTLTKKNYHVTAQIDIAICTENKSGTFFLRQSAHGSQEEIAALNVTAHSNPVK